MLLDGRYRLLELLAEGGMGEVWSALDARSGERVAVKTLRRDLSGSPELRERFEREARALFALEHPHIVAVRDFGIAERKAYIVTELLAGRTLEDLLEDEGPLPPDRALAIGRQVLTALAFAHAQGVIHRDLKAQNVFVAPPLDAPEHAKLLDFGLVRFIDREQWGSSVSLTADGDVLGSPGYISPEQALGHRGDARSDVYSAGVLLFELLTGSWPFFEDDRTRMFRAHLSKPVPPLSSLRPALLPHPDLEALVRRAMSKPPGERFGDGVALLTAFDRVPAPLATLRG